MQVLKTYVVFFCIKSTNLNWNAYILSILWEIFKYETFASREHNRLHFLDLPKWSTPQFYSLSLKGCSPHKPLQLRIVPLLHEFQRLVPLCPKTKQTNIKKTFSLVILDTVWTDQVKNPLVHSAISCTRKKRKIKELITEQFQMLKLFWAIIN